MPTIRTYLKSFQPVVSGVTGAADTTSQTLTLNVTYHGVNSITDKYVYLNLDDAPLIGYHPTKITMGAYCTSRTTSANVISMTVAFSAFSGNPHNKIVPPSGTWLTDYTTNPSTTGSYFFIGLDLVGSGSGFPAYCTGVFSTGLGGGSNAMYFDVECYAPAPRATSLLPSGGFVDKNQPVKISWKATYTEAVYGGTVYQTNAKLRWRTKDAPTYTEINISGAQSSHTFPAGALDVPYEPYIEYQVLVETNGGWSEPSEWITLATGDSIPNAPIINAPKDEYAEIDKPIEFSWTHVIDTGTVQTGAQLQYRTGNSGLWIDLAEVDGDSSTYTLPSNTLPGGTLAWRVRTSNLDNVYGAWSAATPFVGIGTPATPFIARVDISSCPTLHWQSTGQAGYQVQIGDHDTGERYGVDKSYKLPYYIPNGTYAARVRIKSSSGFWSAWAETAFVIDVVAPDMPVLNAIAMRGAVQLTFSTHDKAYLLRDGLPIANVAGLSSYTDHTVLGDAIYTLRAIDNSDNYADSLPAGVTVSVPCAMLAAVSTPDDTVQMRLTRGQPRRITGSIHKGISYHHYAGRKNPVAVYSGKDTRAYEISTAYPNRVDADRLIDLIERAEVMLYRDNWGNRWFVTVYVANTGRDSIATEISMTMTVTDHKEAVDYD